MIYLFDRLYLDSDHYVRNDQKKVTVLLGPIVNDAEQCPILSSDFGPIKKDLSVENENLAAYLQGLVSEADSKRVTIFTTDDMIIKILAFYCASIFNNPTKEFIKQLIMFDKFWIDQSIGVAGHRDIALRHKGYDTLDITNIDSLIDEAMAITTKLTKFDDLRLEYMYGAYLNGTLSPAAKSAFEQKIKVIFYDSNWLGQLVKTFSPMLLTVAAKEGMDLDTFNVETLKAFRPEYTKIYDTAIIGNETCFDEVTLEDWLAYLNKASQDCGWNLKPSLVQFFTQFYADKEGFIREKCLTPAHFNDYFCIADLGKTIKINTTLLYYIVREHSNREFIDNFNLRLL
jgi:hypothetical protein